MIDEPELLRLDLPHLSVAALAWGPPDGRLALCLHGFPDSAWSWQGVATRLAEHGFRVIAPFSRGYAPTALAPDGEYHVAALMYDAVAVHHHLAGGADAVVVGHDWGAFTVNGLAASPETPFSTHVVMSVPSLAAVRARRHPIRRQLRMLGHQLRRSWYILFFQLPALPERLLPRVIPRLWRDWTPPGPDISEGIALAQNALPTMGHRRAALAYYRALVRMPRPSERYRDLYRRRFAMPIRPILHLQGARDGAIDVGYADFLPDVLPRGSVVEVLSGGHFLQLEQPDDVAAAIMGFAGDGNAVGQTD